MSNTWSSWNAIHGLGLIALISWWVALDRWLARRPEGWTMSLRRRREGDR